MAAPTFIIEYMDGRPPETTKLLPRTQLQYEKETKRSLRNDVDSLTEMYELAWYAAGKPEGSLSAWIENVEEVRPEEGEDNEVDPTSPEA